MFQYVKHPDTETARGATQAERLDKIGRERISTEQAARVPARAKTRHSTVGELPTLPTNNFELMEENKTKTVLVTLFENAVSKIKVEVRLEDLFESDQMSPIARAGFLHNVLGWAATKDLAEELQLRGYSVTENK